jgi:hypothetical protein
MAPPKYRAGGQARTPASVVQLGCLWQAPACHDEATSGKVFPLDRLPACLRLLPLRAFLSGSSVLRVFITIHLRPMIFSVPPFQEN